MASSDNEPEGFQIPGTKSHTYSPMTSYVYIAISILVTYALFYMFGYVVLIMVMLLFTIDTLRGIKFILANSARNFARRASYYNLVVVISSFVILAINGFMFMRYGSYLILPEIENFTLALPLMILAAAFGVRNIQGMFMDEPEKKNE